MYRKLVGARFEDVLALAGDEVFDTSTGRGRFIFYNVGPLGAHGKFDVISIGSDAGDAERGMLELLPALLLR